MTKQPRTITVPIVTAPDAEQAALTAKNALDTTSQELLSSFSARVAQQQAMRPADDAETVARAVYDDDIATLTRLEQDLEQAREALAEHVQHFTFRPLGFKAWRALKAAHPSKNKDEAFDVDALAPTLLREASVEPKLSADRVEEILTSPDWSEGEVILLLNAAITVQS